MPTIDLVFVSKILKNIATQTFGNIYKIQFWKIGTIYGRATKGRVKSWICMNAERMVVN